jgi:hypothetical protein
MVSCRPPNPVRKARPAQILAGANRDMKEAKELLSRAFEQQARAVDAIATQVEKDSGWNFMGLDPTPAPITDSSIGAAIEAGYRG